MLEDYKQILKPVLIVYRPLTLVELSSIWEPSKDVSYDRRYAVDYQWDRTVPSEWNSLLDTSISQRPAYFWSNWGIQFQQSPQDLHLFDRYLKALTESKYLLSRLPFPIEQVKLSRSVPLNPVRHCCIHGFITCSYNLTLQMINDMSHIELTSNFSCPSMYTTDCMRFALFLTDSKVPILDIRKRSKKPTEQMLAHMLELACIKTHRLLNTDIKTCYRMCLSKSRIQNLGMTMNAWLQLKDRQ